MHTRCIFNVNFCNQIKKREDTRNAEGFWLLHTHDTVKIIRFSVQYLQGTNSVDVHYEPRSMEIMMNTFCSLYL